MQEVLLFIRQLKHSQLSNEDKLKSGVLDTYVRLSVGIEHIDDIIDDLTIALDKSQEK